MKEKIMELPLAVRVIAPVVVVGLCIGLGLGLYIGWMAWPLQITSVDISDLKGSAQTDYIVLTAKTFACDQNLDTARERLKQLNDPNAAERVANLAIIYASQNKPESAQLAALAVAMGSTKEGIALLAPTSEPVAQAVSATDAPTTIPTLSATPTLSPTAIISATRTATRRPSTATATRPPAAIIAPAAFFPPDLGSGWPGGAYYQPTTVPPGQKFWHLTKAIYCDLGEKRFDCQNLPGGDHGIGIYIIVPGNPPMIIDGKPTILEDKSGDQECLCNYQLFPDGKSIQVGNFPSDKIGGLALRAQYHARFFLTFQLVTQ